MIAGRNWLDAPRRAGAPAWPRRPGIRLMSPKKVAPIFARFAQANPAPTTELEYRTPYQLLVAVILSAQATDKSVNLATRELFKTAGTPQKMARLGEAGLAPYISRIGLYKSKAKNVAAMSQILLDQHGGRGAARPRRAGGPARGRPQNRQRRCSTPSSASRPSPWTPTSSVSPIAAPRPRQGRARGRGEAAEGGPRRVPAQRPPLADPARPLRLQGLAARLPALPHQRPVRMAGENRRDERERRTRRHGALTPAVDKATTQSTGRRRRAHWRSPCALARRTSRAACCCSSARISPTRRTPRCWPPRAPRNACR
jgi:hypothetical protein